MTVTVFNTNSFGGGAYLSNNAQAIGFTPTTGRQLVVFIGGEGTDTVTGLTDSGYNTYVPDANIVLSGNGRRFFRCQTIGTVPTTITAATTGGDSALYYAIWEVTGIASSGSVSQATALTDIGTAHSVSFTTTTDNEFSLLGTIYGGAAGTSSGTAPDTLMTHTRYGWDAVYNADKGTAGAKTLVWSTSTSVDQYALLVSYATATGTVSDPAATTTRFNTSRHTFGTRR